MLSRNIINHKVTNTQTQSLCPVCLKVISACLREESSGLYLDLYCPEHGPNSALVGGDMRVYQQLRQTHRKVTKPLKRNTRHQKGCPHDCGLCPEHDQHTCLAILEITTRCNLSCPICLNSSSMRGRDMTPDMIEAALKELIVCEGRATPLQLSGGEPTLHPHLTGIVKLTRSLGFNKTELNTNGLLLGRNPFLAEELREAGLEGIYLQMDSLDPKVTRYIRGNASLDDKLRCIENCTKAGIQVVLSVTVVPGLNDDRLWEMVEVGIYKQLTGVNFQPVALSGRYPDTLVDMPKRLTLEHFARAMELQSERKILAGDLSPIPCPDPRCGAMAYILIQDGALLPLNRIVKGEALWEQVADLCDWDTLIQKTDWRTGMPCSCQSDNDNSPCDPAESMLNANFFSIGFHAMMDAYNFDIERVRRCCVHALDVNGKRIPFCLYNIRRGWQSQQEKTSLFNRLRKECTNEREFTSGQ